MKKFLAPLAAVATATALHANPVTVPFTNDDNCGISPAKIYTHLVEFGATLNSPVVNGVTFTSSSAASGSMPDPQYTWSGVPTGTQSGDNGINLSPSNPYIVTPSTAGVYKILLDFNYGTATGELQVKGLTPGKAYEFRMYFRKWADPDRTTKLDFRTASASPAPDATITFNPCAARNDQYLAYRYVAGVEKCLYMKFENKNNASANLHLYAFSNELVGGVITPGAVETTHNAAKLHATLENASVDTYDCFAVLVPESAGNPGPDTADWLNAPGAFVSGATNLVSGAITLEFGGLSSGAEYLARLFATNAVFNSSSAAFPVATKDTTPILRATGAVDVTETSAIATGWLDWAGTESGSADVALFWGGADEPGEPHEWGGAPALTNQTVGAVEIPLAGLTLDTEYKYCLAATNGGDSAVSQTLFFRTEGAPKFNSITALNPLPGEFEARADIASCVSAGGTAIVTCWMGAAADALSQTASWQDCEGATNLSHTATGIAAAGARFCAFHIQATLGNRTWSVWSVTNSVNVVGSDTPTALWTGAGDGVWGTAANWQGGVPGNTLGARFIAPFDKQPVLNANTGVLGIWVGHNVDKDVVISGDGVAERTISPQPGAVINGVSASNNPNILLSGPGNRGLTIGPGVRMRISDNGRIYILNDATVDVQGALGVGNGEGAYLWSMNPGVNSVFRFSGKGYLRNDGGGSFNVDTLGSVHVDSSTPFEKGMKMNCGTLRVTSTNALSKMGVNLMNNNNAKRLELAFDTPPENAVINAIEWGANATVDVGRATPGPADGGAVYVRTNNVVGSDYRLTSSHGWYYKTDLFNFPNTASGPKGTAALNPVSGMFDIGVLAFPWNMAGNTTWALSGATATNFIRNAVMNPPGGAFGLAILKNGASVWRLESSNDYTGMTRVNDGRLIVAADEALGGHGPNAAPRVNDDSEVQLNESGILDITGASVTRRIVFYASGSALNRLVNDTPGTLGVVRDGISHIRIINPGSGLSVSHVGQPLDLSLGNGSGAQAQLHALRLCVNSVTVSGGAGWVNDNAIFLPGGTAGAGTLLVTASGGALTGISRVDNGYNPGYGYTSVPLTYTKNGSGTGESVTINDNFAAGSFRVTNPGRGNGYRDDFGVILPFGGAGVVATAVVARVHFNDHWEWARFNMGGNGDLRIDAPITVGRFLNSGGTPGSLYKIGTGSLAITSSNTIPLPVHVEAGALSACNVGGSATGTGRITVMSGAMLAGSGAFKPAAVSNNSSIHLNPGAGIAPHRGTGKPFATLTCDVSANSRADAMRMQGNNFFEFATGPGGADKLVVIGNLQMDAGVNTVRVVPKPGTEPGVYRVIEVRGAFVNNAATWVVEPHEKWSYKLIPETNGFSLRVTAPGTLLMVR